MKVKSLLRIRASETNGRSIVAEEGLGHLSFERHVLLFGAALAATLAEAVRIIIYGALSSSLASSWSFERLWIICDYNFNALGRFGLNQDTRSADLRGGLCVCHR